MTLENSLKWFVGPAVWSRVLRIERENFEWMNKLRAILSEDPFGRYLGMYSTDDTYKFEFESGKLEIDHLDEVTPTSFVEAKCNNLLYGSVWPYNTSLKEELLYRGLLESDRLAIMEACLDFWNGWDLEDNPGRVWQDPHPQERYKHNVEFLGDCFLIDGKLWCPDRIGNTPWGVLNTGIIDDLGAYQERPDPRDQWASLSDDSKRALIKAITTALQGGGPGLLNMNTLLGPKMLKKFVHIQTRQGHSRLAIATQLGVTRWEIFWAWMQGKSSPNTSKRALLHSLLQIPMDAWPKQRSGYQGPPKDRKGEVYGLLTIVSQGSGKASNGQLYWKCLCQCGRVVQRSLAALTSTRMVNPPHCGCLVGRPGHTRKKSS